MGLIRPVIDLAINAWVKPHGDITVYGTWYNDEDDGWVPCMVLMPTFARAGRAIPCVVSMDLAWLWSEEHGSTDLRALSDEQKENIVFAIHKAMEYADALGMAPDKKSVLRIMSIVRDHLGDLISIPPRPANDNEIVVADGLLTVNGKTHHAEIKDDV